MYQRKIKEKQSTPADAGPAFADTVDSETAADQWKVDGGTNLAQKKTGTQLSHGMEVVNLFEELN